MGWTFTHGQSRAELIRLRTQGWDETDGTKYRCLDHRVVGNNLWTVFEKQSPHPHVPTERTIVLFMMQKSGESWGYKDIPEECGPYELSCPLQFLDMVPLPESPFAAEWREKVRKYHARVNQPITIGQEIMLLDGKRYTVLEVKPSIKASPVGGNKVYNIPRRMLAKPK